MRIKPPAEILQGRKGEKKVEKLLYIFLLVMNQTVYYILLVYNGYYILLVYNGYYFLLLNIIGY